MSNPVIYIAGKYRGETAWDVERNVRAAEEWGLMVARCGAIPMIPHTMFRFFHGQLDDSFWLSATRDLVRLCDAMVLIPGWENSRGAVEELKLAETLGMPIWRERPGDAFRRWVEARAKKKGAKP